MDQIKWDTDTIETYINGLNSQHDELQVKEEFLRTLNSRINEVWQGMAGTSFDTVMEFDIENYKKVVELLSVLSDDMKQVKSKYSNCEDMVKNTIAQLKTKVV